jgi:SulP family sulfate permease
MSTEPPTASPTARRPSTGRGWALRDCLREGYGAADLRADIVAGLTVGIIAVPLSMALAIASGMPPQAGLYTAIVAGFIAAALGGSRYSITGPTAAFVVILAPVAARYGPGGLMVSTMMAGIFLLAMGAGHFGRLIQFIPYPVTTGFTAGIAVVIATLQVKDFLGLSLAAMPEHYIDKLALLVAGLDSLRWEDTLVGVVSLAVLIILPRISRRVPAPLVVSILGALLGIAVPALLGGGAVATIGSRFSYVLDGVTRAGVPPLPPTFMLPWMQPGADGQPIGLTWQLIRDLSAPALAIGLLGAIESLLCAVVADGMTGTKHDPDRELIGQGMANLLVPFLGGFAATGAIARTAAGLRAGARSPITGIVHALFVLVAMLLLAPLLAYLPMATLAALLLMVAWNMSDLKHFAHILRVAPKSDVIVLLACFGLTVIFDMVIAVSVGIVLASLLFMQRMAAMTQGTMLDEAESAGIPDLPPGVRVYEIRGPLFFGAAERAISSLADVSETRHTVMILSLASVPYIDVTGMVAFESLLERLHREGVFVILTGLQDQPAGALRKAGIQTEPGRLAFCHDMEQAVMLAALHRTPSSPAVPLPT